jgi:hypothetical protein
VLILSNRLRPYGDLGTQSSSPVSKPNNPPTCFLIHLFFFNQDQQKMKQKHLISALQNLDGFEKPRIDLEQYGTPPEIAGLNNYANLKRLKISSRNPSTCRRGCEHYRQKWWWSFGR